MRTTTSTLALAAFLGSTAMTGAGLALVAWFTVGQAVWLAMVGPPLMLLSGGLTVGTWPSSLDKRMAENQTELSLSRPARPPAMRLTPSNGHNPYSRTWPETRRR